MSDTAVVLDECGCCETIAPAAPAIDNPPGLSAIAYRIGTQPLFKARMKAALGTRPELLGLTARDESDPSIALVDAWATVLDVLTFYQERIATEGYLRTATETQSVYSLAAEISYLPNPGVAADVLLAFQLDTSPGSPGDVPIPVGTRVQSLPDPNAKPQTFETVEVVDARPEWNVLFPRRTVRQHLAIDETSVVLAGTSTLLRPGDALLFVGHHRRVKASSQHWDFRILESVSVDTVAGTTTVTWSRGLGKHVSIHISEDVQGHQIDVHIKKVHPVRAELHVYAMKTRAGIFGFNAPDWRLIPDTIRPHYYTGTTVPAEWPHFDIWSPPGKLTHDTIDLDTVYAEAAQGAYAAVALQTYVELFDIVSATQAARADFGLSSKVTRIKLEPSDPLHPNDPLKNPLKNFELFVRDTVVHLQGPEVTLADIRLTNPVQGRSIPLDRVVEGLNPGKQIIVTGKRARAIVTQHLKFVASDGTKVSLQPGESVQMTRPYTWDSGTAQITWYIRAPGGQEGDITASSASSVLRWTPALDSDQPIAEVATIEGASELIDGTTTRLRLHDPLANCYDRASLKINANVVHATHGETKHEVLGSGDASRPFQTFTLKQAPLTYVSSASATGAATTLDLRVDDLAWTEVPTLYGQGPHDQVYVVRMAAGGEVRVEFGDGITGARLPTGVENVKANYRVGTGTPGMVGADRIKLLMTRPLGVQSVDNPVAAGIAADAEGLDSARGNAPQQVVTFSRVVSLTDFEDFARAFAGIAKAQANWVWDGSSRTVNVTVAGTNGAPVTSGGETYPKLKTAITSYADPHQRFQLSSFEDLRFAIKASLFLEAGRDETVVVPAAIRAIRDAFSFERRSLGQPVFESEVIAALQATLGVMAVDLTGLHLARGSGMTPALPALRGRYDNGIQPAQLLSIGDGATDVDLKVAT
jgi:predicted phage baseplate assembly protein